MSLRKPVEASGIMARMGRPTVETVLPDDERETLPRWSRRATSAQALALRCRIVLAGADGLSNTQVGSGLGIHPTTVATWRKRFAADRLEGLADEKRCGPAPTVTDEQVEE
ncbi:helix-turn-helix domain-containing protein [Streptomyces sp. TG1A-60]|uniref:helix-turn-helix domain-containing protein n=1 Tax=Streptomyces sp. TG1A-60 TaxID=3129111 RepID=UPI0030CCACE6